MLYEVITLEALRLALGESTIMMMGTPGLAGALDGLRLGPDLIRTNPAGEIWVHYRHDDPRLYVPAADVLDDSATERVRPLIEGQIVLIGTSTAGLLDLRTTALGETVPGVSIHAQIIDRITSYNVCYTKLLRPLRASEAHHDRYDQPKRDKSEQLQPR